MYHEYNQLLCYSLNWRQPFERAVELVQKTLTVEVEATLRACHRGSNTQKVYAPSGHFVLTYFITWRDARVNFMIRLNVSDGSLQNDCNPDVSLIV